MADDGWLSVPLQTSRLVVRAPEDGDREALVGLLTDVRVRRYVGGALTDAAAHAAVSDALAGLSGDQFVIVERTAGRIIGSGDIRVRPDAGPELSYQLAASWWGRGYAGEALTAVLAAYFTASCSCELTALTQQANARSVALLERLGATLYGREQYKGHPQLRYRWPGR